MHFVPKDRGESSENSSGGGTQGILKELFYMLLTYGVMIGVMILVGLLTVGFISLFI